MADYIDVHNDFFYPKGHSGLEAVIHLQVLRRLLRKGVDELNYVFPQHIAHGEVINQLDYHLKSMLTILNDVLQQKKNKKSC